MSFLKENYKIFLLAVVCFLISPLAAVFGGIIPFQLFMEIAFSFIAVTLFLTGMLCLGLIFIKILIYLNRNY